MKMCMLIALHSTLVWFKHSTKWFDRHCVFVWPSYCNCNLIFGLFLYFVSMSRCFLLSFLDVYDYVLRESDFFLSHGEVHGKVRDDNESPKHANTRFDCNIVLVMLPMKNYYCM